ncbi:hypothetical protein pETSU_157 [Edwardsiella phage pEt-SU]|uniref:Uncharacterized protein n=1 Tax=Edwardsiella phage pEt-SU TaxID=2562142 RepID=A0A4D6DWZ4_9CAUD|nr:hypothetical protein HOV39_gp157 [Edwardsiella phage pEt-SU]QBZ70738.1 hypothetical protein pETSU_157 [Edwardsiella phage pEt-SU]
MDNAAFFDCGVSVLDMVYDTLVGIKTEKTVYRTSINGAPTDILLSNFMDSTVAVGKRQNLSFLAAHYGGKTKIWYNREKDVITKDEDPKRLAAFIQDPTTVSISFPACKESFIAKLTQTVLI